MAAQKYSKTAKKEPKEAREIAQFRQVFVIGGHYNGEITRFSI